MGIINRLSQRVFYCAAVVLILSTCFVQSLYAQASPVPKTDTEIVERAAWFDEAKYGMFIHWGLYSILEDGEWVFYHKKIPLTEYSQLAERFNPTKFDAEQWVKIAKGAGMKYITITSKHHDGFALFDSNVSKWDVVDATPYKRDLIKELAAACEKEGIRLGLYYSHAQDWYHHGGISDKRSWDAAQKGGDFEKYLKQVSIPQIKEILNQYNPALIWFDTPHRMDAKIASEIAAVVRDLKPNTLINSRLLYHGYQIATLTQEQLDELTDIGVDYLSYRDRQIPENSPWQYWETCMTLNHSWGYNAKDDNWKTPTKVIRQLVEVVSKGGSFLLNVGPTAEGEIPAESVEILTEVGAWLKVNGEAIYGATPTPLQGVGIPSAESLRRIQAQEKMAAKTGAGPRKKIKPEIEYEWLATGKDGKIYIHLFKWPSEPFVLSNLEGKVSRAYLLADPKKKSLQYTQTAETLTVTFSAIPVDDKANVLCLVFE